MKRKLLVCMMSIVLALSCCNISRGNVVSAIAAEIETNKDYQMEGQLIDKDSFYELSVGDPTYVEASVLKTNGT